jgi:hypothetical protein
MERNGPAFPTPYITRDGDCFSTEYRDGLTKRELFAAMAMQGLITSSEKFWVADGEQATTPEHFARIATMYADALLAALATGAP